MNPIGSCRSVLVVLAACVVLQLAYAVPTQNDAYREYHGTDGEDDNVAHRLESIGGAHLIRELERQGHLPRPQIRGGLDSLSGITFGGNKRLDSLSGITFGNQKRNFDEIDRAGFNSFVKKNFDEIDRAGFDSFVKRNFDEIDRVGFGSFVKRNSPLLLARLYDKENN